MKLQEMCDVRKLKFGRKVGMCMHRHLYISQKVNLVYYTRSLLIMYKVIQDKSAELGDFNHNVILTF